MDTLKDIVTAVVHDFAFHRTHRSVAYWIENTDATLADLIEAVKHFNGLLEFEFITADPNAGTRRGGAIPEENDPAFVNKTAVFVVPTRFALAAIIENERSTDCIADDLEYLPKYQPVISVPKPTPATPALTQFLTRLGAFNDDLGEGQMTALDYFAHVLGDTLATHRAAHNGGASEDDPALLSANEFLRLNGMNERVLWLRESRGDILKARVNDQGDLLAGEPAVEAPAQKPAKRTDLPPIEARAEQTVGVQSKG